MSTDVCLERSVSLTMDADARTTVKYVMVAMKKQTATMRVASLHSTAWLRSA